MTDKYTEHKIKLFKESNDKNSVKDAKVFKEYVFPKEVIKDLVKTLDKNGNAYFLNHIKEVYFSKNGLKYNELFGKEMIKNGKIYYDYDLNEIKVTKVEINQLEDKTRI